MNKILESLYDDPGYTITELANIMKMSRKSISNNIKKLKDLGFKVLSNPYDECITIKQNYDD